MNIQLTHFAGLKHVMHKATAWIPDLTKQIDKAVSKIDLPEPIKKFLEKQVVDGASGWLQGL